jgi:hypothetical protein
MRKQYIVILTFSLTCLGSVLGNAQEKSNLPNLAAVADSNAWKLVNTTAETVEVDGKHAVRLRAKGDSADRIAGLALPVGGEFTTGMIELDLKGENFKQGSFLGVVFNVANDTTFEGVYFRPFNFKAEEPNRSHSVQYIAWPENTCEKLRKEQPGRFEKAVDPVPYPDGWFHARIEVGDSQVRVYVNDAKEPCLVAERLKRANAKRPLGLFVDVAEGLYANLKVTPGN